MEDAPWVDQILTHVNMLDAEDRELIGSFMSSMLFNQVCFLLILIILLFRTTSIQQRAPR